jgi:hypothetical protein
MPGELLRAGHGGEESRCFISLCKRWNSVRFKIEALGRRLFLSMSCRLRRWPAGLLLKES